MCINAINFSSEGMIRISVLRKGKGVEFVISDNGIGIPREDLYDIFTPFKMGSNAESKRRKGSRLSPMQSICRSPWWQH